MPSRSRLTDGSTPWPLVLLGSPGLLRGCPRPFSAIRGRRCNSSRRVASPAQTLMTPCPPDGFIADYVDGRLGPKDRARVDEHLAVCAACRQLVAASCAEEARRRTGEIEVLPQGRVER